jgi:hypothetical protein
MIHHYEIYEKLTFSKMLISTGLMCWLFGYFTDVYELLML